MRRAPSGIVVAAIVLAVGVLLRVYLARPGAAPPAYWPTTAWRTAAPEEQGMDSARLADALVAIRGKSLNIHGLLVVRNGDVVLDASFYPTTARRRTSWRR
jgi:hypothetical protein